MSLFGTSPSEEPTLPSNRSNATGDSGLFDEPAKKQSASGLFEDGSNEDDGTDSPWSMPTPRKKESRADMVRNLLPASDVPESYIETYDTILRENGKSGGITADGVHKIFAVARLHDAGTQKRIVSLIAPDGLDGDDVTIGRQEFNVLLALVGLAQEDETISLDTVDERRRNLPQPKLQGLTAEPVVPPVEELAAKPPQTPSKESRVTHQRQPSHSQAKLLRTAMDDPEDDPWNTPDVHKNHNHPPAKPTAPETNGNGFHAEAAPPSLGTRSTSQYTTETPRVPQVTGATPGQGGWGAGYFDGNSSNPVAATGDGFSAPAQEPIASPFGGAIGGDRAASRSQSSMGVSRTISGRTGAGIEENILVNLMPEKEGVFMFQHHNYEVASQRKTSKVIRRYSDFVWLLDCLHKRYPFRVLPLLPPKRVAVNGNHFSNDNGFIEKRRRGLARFLNAVVRHPILSQEQLVVMFLTVPTELAVWRKQATISMQDEFAEKSLPPGLEESLPPTLEELFDRTKTGVKRSAELYINICTLIDRLVKRQEGVAADHARIAMSLQSLTETSSDTYATDDNEVPLLNDGLVAMSKHLRTTQALMEDESKGWDQGVLEDLKRQRDALVSVREMFDRREKLDKDNIPYLERKIQTNETKLASLRSKPDGTVKPGEIEKVAESIIKDKESIVQQHNRSIFVKECLRDELITFQHTQYHVSRWNQDWAGERVKYAEMLADNWRRLLDELEGMPLGE